MRQPVYISLFITGNVFGSDDMLDFTLEKVSHDLQSAVFTIQTIQLLSDRACARLTLNLKAINASKSVHVLNYKCKKSCC